MGFVKTCVRTKNTVLHALQNGAFHKKLQFMPQVYHLKKKFFKKFALRKDVRKRDANYVKNQKTAKIYSRLLYYDESILYLTHA